MHVQVTQVVELVVQHGEDVELRDVSSLLLLNTACRRALCSSVGRLSIDTLDRLRGPTGRVRNILQLVSPLAAWLPQYAGLVQHLYLRNFHRREPADGCLEAAEQLMTLSLSQSTRPYRQAGSSSSSNDPVVPALQLLSLETDFLVSPKAIQSLAACTNLTRLVVADVPRSRITPAFSAALGHLLSLKQLEVSVSAPRNIVVPLSLAQALANLTQLEELTVRGAGCMGRDGLAQLPASLTRVMVTVGAKDGKAAAATTAIDLSHLSSLQQLVLAGGSPDLINCHLPPGLNSVDVFGMIDIDPGGLRLQQLKLTCQLHPTSPLLKRLGGFSQLKHLEVRLCTGDDGDVGLVAAGIAAAAHLTALRLYNFDKTLFDCTSAQLHTCLCRLPALRSLHLVGLRLARSDAVHLTGLSPGLTELSIISCVVDELAVAAMLGRLTNLRSLVLQNLGLQNEMLWAVLGGLTNLCSLECLDNPIRLSNDNRPLLSALTNLTDWVVDEESEEEEFSSEGEPSSDQDEG